MEHGEFFGMSLTLLAIAAGRLLRFGTSVKKKFAGLSMFDKEPMMDDLPIKYADDKEPSILIGYVLAALSGGLITAVIILIVMFGRFMGGTW